MFATAKNYDVICLQMRNHLQKQDSPIGHETSNFIQAVSAILKSNSPIKPELDKFIPRIFNFRMMAIRWLGQQNGLDLSTLIDANFPSIEALQKNKKLALLGENIMFAIRCNKRVVNAILNQGGIGSDKVAKDFADAPLISYTQFLGTLALSLPDEASVQLIADWLHSSLYIEFIVLAGILINEDQILVAKTVISEMAMLVADAAQEYSAIATQMGLLNKNEKKTAFDTVVNQMQLDDDQLLSDLDLQEFEANFK